MLIVSRTAIAAALALVLAAACSAENPKAAESGAAQAAPMIPSDAPIPAGDYNLDPMHATLLFRVNHIGYSNYTASFSDFDASLRLDPENPEKASLSASVDVSSIVLPAPPAGFHDTLMSPPWFDAGANPKMTFKSNRIEMTDENAARIHGDLTLRGVTKPAVLEATFNGGYAGMPVYDPQARLGFSAHGTVNRSDFGMDEGIPPPGTSMGVSDAVDIIIEAEFLGPPLPESE